MPPASPTPARWRSAARARVFVGSRNKPAGDTVYAVVDQNGDQKADQVIPIAKGLNEPSGVAFRDGTLYVGEISRVVRFDNIESKLASRRGEPVVVNDTLPTRHASRPEVHRASDPTACSTCRSAAPCNICDKEKDDPRYATILRMKPDGIGTRGVRQRRAQHASASTGIRRPARCGSPTTAATTWATTCRATS